MTTNERTLLTIVTEASIESKLIHEIESLGAHGFTITEARGKGQRGVRNADWTTETNIKIEIICTPDTANKISSHLQENYFQYYAMIMFSHDVSVLRANKF